MSVQTGPLGGKLGVGPNGFIFQGPNGRSIAAGQNEAGKGVIVNGPRRNFTAGVTPEGDVNAIFRGPAVGERRLA